jgi:hypothetical protein
MNIEMKQTSKSWQCLDFQETGGIFRSLLAGIRAQEVK